MVAFPLAVHAAPRPAAVHRVDSPAADRAQVDYVRVGHVVFPQQERDRAVRHSNVLAARPGLRPPANVDRGANVDSVGEGPPINNLAVSSVCRAIVMSVAKVPSLIADKNGLAVRGLEGPLKASGSPKDVTVCPTGVRNRSKTELAG